MSRFSYGRMDNPCRGLPGLRQIHHGPVARAAVQGRRPTGGVVLRTAAPAPDGRGDADARLVVAGLLRGEARALVASLAAGAIVGDGQHPRERLASGAGVPNAAPRPRPWPHQSLHPEDRRGHAGRRPRTDLSLAAGTGGAMLDQPGLDRLVGEYRQGRRTFTVSIRDAGLVLDDLLWPRNRLLPVGPGVFEAESWPRLLTFEDADGEVRAVRFEGPHVDYLQHCKGVYEKIR